MCPQYVQRASWRQIVRRQKRSCFYPIPQYPLCARKSLDDHCLSSPRLPEVGNGSQDNKMEKKIENVKGGDANGVLPSCREAQKSIKSRNAPRPVNRSDSIRDSTHVACALACPECVEEKEQNYSIETLLRLPSLEVPLRRSTTVGPLAQKLGTNREFVLWDELQGVLGSFDTSVEHSVSWWYQPEQSWCSPSA